MFNRSNVAADASVMPSCSNPRDMDPTSPIWKSEVPSHKVEENLGINLTRSSLTVSAVRPLRYRVDSRRTTLERLEYVDADDASSGCDSATYHPLHPVWESPPQTLPP